MGNISHTTGNVGIGISTPQRDLSIYSGAPTLQLIATGSGSGVSDGLIFSLENSGVNAQMWNHENGFIRFGNNNAETVRITSTGDVGIGTTSPTVKLDVNGDIKGTNITASGTVTVGNFGGSTNVMVKPTLTAGVGQIVPLFHYSTGQPTVLLPAGTWFIKINGQMNATSGAAGSADENTVLIGVFTVTVPSDQKFTLATYKGNGVARSGNAETDRSGLIYRFTDASFDGTAVIPASTTVPTGWTEFTESASAPFKAKAYTIAGSGSGFSKSTPAVDGGHSVIYHVDSSLYWVAAIQGYAIRIA